MVIVFFVVLFVCVMCSVLCVCVMEMEMVCGGVEVEVFVVDV